MKQCALCGSLVEDSAETCPHDGHASWLLVESTEELKSEEPAPAKKPGKKK